MWRIVTPHYTLIGYFSIKIRDDCFDVNCCAGDSHTRTGLIDSVEFGGVVSKVNYLRLFQDIVMDVVDDQIPKKSPSFP